MNAQVKTPRKVTVTPADPKYAEAGKDIRKRHLRVAPYCRVSTGSEECQRRRGFVVFWRTENVEKWRVAVYSL